MKSLRREDWIKLTLGAALLMGALIRFRPGLEAGFPLNDGGMFLGMIRDLQASHYLLPPTSSYNYIGIPFAYPPFGFYLARLVSDVFGFTEIALLLWLPPLVNTLSILAFFLLASSLLESRTRGAAAAVFYAFTPVGYGWFVMGGGLTRSLGSLFLLLSVWSVYRLFREGSPRALALSVLFCTLTVVSHPEAGVHTAASCILLWLFHGRTVRSTMQALLVGAGVSILSAPWWLTVISYHGIAPFLSALHTGSHGLPLLQSIYYAVISRDGYVPVLPFLRVVGIVWGAWKRNFFLLLWAILPFIVEPRSAPSVAFYPFTMLIAVAAADAIPFVHDLLRRRTAPEAEPEFTERGWLNLVLFVTLIYLFVEANLYGFKLINNTLKEADLAAMDWIHRNTPVQSRFLVVTGVLGPEIDPFSEWFPVLAERHGIATLQGLEWMLGPAFTQRRQILLELQGCQTAKCISDWTVRNGFDYDYVVVWKSDIVPALASSLKGDEHLSLVYESQNALILESVP